MIKARGVLHGYTEIDATDDQNRDLVEKFGITSAPTLVTIHDGKVRKYENASQIIGYAKAN